MKKLTSLFFLFFCCFNFIAAQQNKFVIQNEKLSDKIRFNLVNNLIIIPVEVNGVELSFILDTGVSKPIVFNSSNISDSLDIKNTETLFIRGLGNGEPIEALKSTNNMFKIGDAVKLKQDMYAVDGLGLNFGPRLGEPIHGIIGLDLFRDFIVEINYTSKYIELFDYRSYRYKRCRKCERFNLMFYNNKPYINAHVKLNHKKIPVKLLIDTGGSDSLWLFEDDSLGIVSGNKFFKDFLGHGLSGSVYGKRSKIKTFYLKSFHVKSANVAYPDSTSIVFAKKIKNRNGSIAGNMLRRFNIIIDYRNSLITLKKNSNFNEPFAYNKSGIELAHNGIRAIKEYEPVRGLSVTNRGNRQGNGVVNGAEIVLENNKYRMILKPAYAIVELREGSPAAKAGLLKGDIILAINGRSVNQMTLQQITAMFYEKAGKQIRLKIARGELTLTYSFYLENLLD